MESVNQRTQLVSTSSTMVAEEVSTPLEIFTSFITASGPWIVLIWFVVFLFKCVRMTGDLRQVYRARNYQTIVPSEEWLKRVSELQLSLQIKRRVQLLESKLVTIPSVTGFIKPIILVPVGLLSNIPQDQVEAILLHELAHIRRSDYLINFVQTFIEILFFFNPGIVWISTLLKDERENCCDDLAISVTNNKKEFVNALVSFQEHHLHAQRFALQFSDQKMKLADRAKRILFNTNKVLSIREKYFLSASLAVSAVLFLVVMNVNSSSAQEVKSTKNHNFSGSHTTVTSPGDTLHKGEYQEIDISEEERIMEEASRIIEIHSAKIEEYSAVIEKHAAVIEQQTKILEAEVNKPSDKINWKKHDEAQSRIEAEQAKIEAESAKIDIESRKIDEQSIIIDEQSRKIDAKVRLQEKEIQRMEAVYEDITKTIMDDLKAAGYSGNINSFELSEKGVKVNGKPQPDSIFQKVKKHIQPGMRVVYNVDVD